MTDSFRLLDTAVEDNIAWCSAVCSAHGSKGTASSIAWVNLARSPPFYPNIITRKRDVQGEIIAFAHKVREANQSRNWGIKDSFADLDLTGQGFESVLSADWYGGTVSQGDSAGWNTVTSPAQLHLWEKSWGSSGDRIFPSSLLENPQISFWFKGQIDGIQSGFISFNTGFSVGISNWFSVEDDSFTQIGLLKPAGLVARGLPIVCWSEDKLEGEEMELQKLGPLRIWISQ